LPQSINFDGAIISYHISDLLVSLLCFYFREQIEATNNMTAFTQSSYIESFIYYSDIASD